MLWGVDGKPKRPHRQFMTQIFTGSFTQQDPIPDDAIAAANAVLQSGRLHRYNLMGDEVGEVSLLEEEFAALTGAKYCLAVASGGYAMGAALRALQVQPGQIVLTNAFTLAPVPGAIAAVGAVPDFIEVTQDLVIDLDHLAARIEATGATVLMLSHMRGHICDMDALMALCDGAGVTVIEDCAHTMGAAWKGKASGRFGAVGCFSTQTYKHVNSGEGGLMITDDAELAARMILLSGSYMLYARHTASPPLEVFEKVRLDVPNVSGRMDHLRAAILRPQLVRLSDQAARWNARYAVMEDGLRNCGAVRLITRRDGEAFVASSFQFQLPGWGAGDVQDFLGRCGARGVELKWFGADAPVGFTSRYAHWAYANPPSLPQTDAVLAGLVDMRLPLTFSLEDCALVASIIRSEAETVWQGLAAAQ
jgi:dTDP-4-amino-4,6-dideoxygalactose transaminase